MKRVLGLLSPLLSVAIIGGLGFAYWYVFYGPSASAEAKGPQAAPPSPTVTVTTVERVRIADVRERVGRVVAVDDVQLEARVSGYLAERRYTEGRLVQKGDLLFVIEKAPFEAEVARARAELERAKAAVRNTELTLKRVRELQLKGHSSKQSLDDALARRDQAVADVAARKAALRQSEINLSYTEIRAPVAGRIGRALFSVGDRVGPDKGTLARIVTVDPIHVTWTAGEQVALDFRRANVERATRGQAALDVKVMVKFPDGTAYGHEGVMSFVDNVVDPATGTQTARADFANPDGLLVPGQFVAVFPKVGEARERLAVPQTAVQQDQIGRFVFVVDAQNKVERRQVGLGRRQGVLWVVRSGLRQGERVIFEGVQKVRPGAVVTPVAGKPQALAQR
ncbi:MAG: efflux RND transporter periplasmic adaptor subunit [Methyloligellaceae bacterium]